MKKKIGAITIGQAPRDDVTPDIMGILGDVELLQAGGLDGLTREEIAKFAPVDGDYVLISRLKDGSSVTFAEKHIVPRLQQCIYDLEAQGVSLIMVFCTGDFPEFESHVPLIVPCKLLNGLVPAISNTGSIAVITPKPEQVQQSINKWKNYVDKVASIPGSPYGDPSEIDRAAEQIKALEDVDLIVMDCIGYTAEMKARVAQITGKNVILSRTILAHVVAELLS